MEDMALKRASSSPHIHAGRTVQGVMLEVIVALVPAGAFGVLYFRLARAAHHRGVGLVGGLLGVAVRAHGEKALHGGRPQRRGHGRPAGLQSARQQCPCGCR